MRTPTEKQYQSLRSLGSTTTAGLSWSKRTCEPFLKHGWVTAEWDDPYYQWVRITPEGLRALALAVERYGLPRITGGAKAARRVCSDCGGTRFHVEYQSAEEAMA